MTLPSSTPSPVVSGATMDRRLAPSGFRARVRRGKWWIIALALSVTIALLWWLIPEQGSTSVKASGLETGLVTRAPFADYAPLRATVAPRITTLISSATGGQIAELLVADGAQVVKGQALLRLSNPELRLEILGREAELTARLGDLNAQRLALENARNARAREVADSRYRALKANNALVIRESLHAKGIVSDAGVKIVADEARFERDQLARIEGGAARENRIAGDQAVRLDETRGQLGATLAAVRESLDALTVRAPIAGQLTNFSGVPGQMVKPGDPLGQVDALGAWKLVADVDEYFLGRIAIGQEGVGQAPGGAVHLTVSRILPQVSNGRFRIELVFASPPPAGLNRGQTLDLRLNLGGDTRPVITAPAGPWAGNAAEAQVFVLDPDGRHARRRTVRLGRRTLEQVEILSGLRPGERIVTSSTPDLAKSQILNLE